MKIKNKENVISEQDSGLNLVSRLDRHDGHGLETRIKMTFA
jgi:hypothetical protein